VVFNIDKKFMHTYFMIRHLFVWRKQKIDTLKVNLNRDSVCAGDDCDSHRIELEFDAKATIRDLVKRIKKSNYLASITGGKATWILMNAGNEIAVLAQQWGDAKCFLPEATLLSDLHSHDNQMFFFVKYLGQLPPDSIYIEIDKRKDFK
jgi:hypothetical protein